MARFVLGAKDNEIAAGVICSFDSRWQEQIHSGRVRVVFRKKRLVKSMPEWLYVYLATPVSAITARMRISEASVMTVSDALDLADEGDIPKKSLQKYADVSAVLFVISVRDVEIAKSPIPSSLLASLYAFWPSPNFIRISEAGVKTLDALGEFGPKE